MKKSVFIASLFAADSEMKSKEDYATVQLSNGLKIPQFGIGTYGSSEQQAHGAVLEALKDGYRPCVQKRARNCKGNQGKRNSAL